MKHFQCFWLAFRAEQISAFVAIYGCLFHQLLGSSRNDFPASNIRLRLLALPFFFFQLDFSYHFVLQTQRFPGILSDKETQQGEQSAVKKIYIVLGEATHLTPGQERGRGGMLLTNKHKKKFTILFECLCSAQPKAESVSGSKSKPRCHPVWITQETDRAYDQDISSRGVAHSSFVKKQTKKTQTFHLKKCINIVMEKSGHC